MACNFKDGNTCDAGRIRGLRQTLRDMGVVMHQWDCPRNMVVTALAHMQRQDVYYLICGQGQLREMLQQYADSLGIGMRIRMIGFQEDMPWIYQNADIFVLPSVREGLPAALMEAMAAGLPCAVSDIRGS